VAAVIYAATGVVLGFPIALATVLPAVIHPRETGTGLSAPVIPLIELAVLIIVPIFYALLGFIISVVGATIDNLVARWLGGLEIDAE
jgi:hypothetical protein